MGLLLKILVNGLAVFFTAWILPGVLITDYTTAVIVGILLAIVNTFLRPILLILTLPINILTLGLFTFVINAILVLLVDSFVGGFKVDTWLWALLFSIILAVVNSLFHKAVS